MKDAVSQETLEQTIRRLEHQKEMMALRIRELEQELSETQCDSEFCWRAFDAVSNPLCIIDANYRVIRMNRAQKAELGLDDVDIPAGFCYELFHKLDHPPDFCTLEKTLTDQVPCQAKIFDGSSGRHLKISTYPIADPDGDVAKVLHSIHDLSQRKELEQNLQESQERLQMLLDTTPDSICFKDGRGRWLASSRANLRLFQLEEVETRGRTDEELSLSTPFYRDALLVCAQTDEKAWKKGDLSRNEEEIPTPNGPNRIFDVIKMPVFHQDGRRRELLILGRDITSRVKLEERLRQSQKMEAIGTLAGGIAHDFNNILMSIMGFTEMAMMDLPENAHARQDLAEALSSANRAKELVGQILAFSRQEKKQARPLLVVPILKEALKLVRHSLPSTIEIRQNLPPDASAIMADPTDIYQIFMNLFTNAGQAMKEKGGILEVGLETVIQNKSGAGENPGMSRGRFLKISVSDTGPGIPKSQIHRIFDPYFTTKMPGEGTGLGLAVVHSIVSELDGYIDVSSEPGAGTVFELYFPMLEDMAADEKPQIEEVEGIPFGSGSILIVDDEKSILQMLYLSLESFGFEVTTRVSGIDALEAFRANPDRYDVVVTDLTMPNMTGDRLAMEIKRIRPDVPIILCTGFSEKLSKEWLSMAGIDEVQMKPVSGTGLAWKLRKILDRRHSASK